MKKIYIILAFIIILCSGCSDTNVIGNDSDINVSKGMEESDEMPKSYKVNGSGLLLGLKKTSIIDEEPTEYETIWIAEANDGIVIRRGKDFLTVPYKDKFYKIENKIYEEKKLIDGSEKSLDEITILDYEYKFHFIDTVAYPSDEEAPEIYKEEIGWGDGYWPIRTEKDEVLFVGNKNIVINRQYYETGGGTFRSSWYSNVMYDIKSLNQKYKEDSIDLYDYFQMDDEQLESCRNKYNHDVNDKQGTNSYITIKQVFAADKPFLERRNGQWLAMIPVDQEFNHKGNGSVHINMADSIEVINPVSDELLCFDKLNGTFEVVKKQIPDVRDVISSPNEKLLVTLVGDRIDIYQNQDINKLGEPDLSIDIDEEQTIVSNQWAIGKYVEKWNLLLEEFLVTVK